MPAPISDDIRAAILADIKAGQKSRAQIARDHGVAGSTVAKVADQAGETADFARARTENATRAVQADLAKKRAEISARLLEKAAELIAQMDEPHLVFSFGGKDNQYAERTIPKPTTGDVRNLMTSAAIALDKHMKIQDYERGLGDQGDKGVVGEIFLRLRDNRAQRDAPADE